MLGRIFITELYLLLSNYSEIIYENAMYTDRLHKCVLCGGSFLFYVLVFKIFLCCWRLICVFIVLVKLR